MSDLVERLKTLRHFLDGSDCLRGFSFGERAGAGAFWWRKDLCTIDEAAARVAALEAERDRLREALAEMAPHVAKIERCIRINDDMGRVVTGQTEAAAEIARIHRAALGGDNG